MIELGIDVCLWCFDLVSEIYIVEELILKLGLGFYCCDLKLILMLLCFYDEKWRLMNDNIMSIIFIYF